MQAVITDAGATGAKIKLYNAGAIPANVTPATGNTLLATGVWAAGPIGTAINGTIAYDAAGMTQTNSAHVAGVPTFAHLTTSADVVVARVDICTGSNAPCWAFSGAIAPGQNMNLGGLVFTASNP